MYGHSHIIKKLLKNGANIDYKLNSGYNAFISACRNKREEAI